MSNHIHPIVHWLIATIAVLIAAWLLPGVHVAGPFVAFVVAVVLGAVNMVIRPVLLLLTLPLNIVTFGLFTFVLNALLVEFVSLVVPGFSVAGFGWALLFSLVVSFVSLVLRASLNDHHDVWR